MRSNPELYVPVIYVYLAIQGAASVYILNNLERRKDKLKTQLVWIGAQKEPLITARTWRWVDGEYFAL